MRCFSLTKSTARILNKQLGPPDPLGAGMQAGGRGLSGDLSLVEEKNGRIEQKKVVLPIDKLLAELENPKRSTSTMHRRPVEAVQIGDREKLIGQKDRLKVFARHRDGEIRGTAFWALGRWRTSRWFRCCWRGWLRTTWGDDGSPQALCTLVRKPRGYSWGDVRYHPIPPTTFPTPPRRSEETGHHNLATAGPGQLAGLAFPVP
ncbi:MAG: hypothetical protein CM1200mP2_35560 [Planctomycetaceae bacterium]|nr:MAG: hypothetical protein CM1200mP2_35560 [Planctomycetaceae bacterium]